jgi:hypothetical protein
MIEKAGIIIFKNELEQLLFLFLLVSRILRVKMRLVSKIIQ